VSVSWYTDSMVEVSFSYTMLNHRDEIKSNYLPSTSSKMRRGKAFLLLMHLYGSNV
jgi:hypothetical protein